MKGFAHALIVLGIIFIVWILILSFAFNLTSLTQRQLAEAKTIIEAEDVENILRSLENSFRLSFVQSIYDSANTGEYWQNYNQNFLTDGKIGGIKDSVYSNFESYANRFLQQYADYAKASKPDNTLLVDSLKNSAVTARECVKDSTAALNNCVGKDEIQVFANKVELESKYRNVKIRTNLEFEYSVGTRIFQFFDVAKNFISSDRLGTTVSKVIKDYVGGIGGDRNSNPPKATYSIEFCPERKLLPADPYPTPEDLFSSGSGRSIPEAQLEMGQRINSELGKVEQEFSDFQKSFSIVDRNVINPISGGRGIKTEIKISDCNVVETGKCTGTKEEIIEKTGKDCDAVGPGKCYAKKTTVYEDGPQKMEYCTYLFYGTVNSKIEIKDSGKKYSLWDKITSQNVFDSLKISFNAISGNKAGAPLPAAAIQLSVSGPRSGPNCAVYDSKCGPSLAVCKVGNVDCREQYNLCNVFPSCTAGGILNYVYFTFKIKNTGSTRDMFTVISDVPTGELSCVFSPKNTVTLDPQGESEFAFTCGFYIIQNKEWSVKVSAISNSISTVRATQTLNIKYVG